MGIESRLTAKGQTTIPVEVRDYLGLGPGDRIQYVLMDGKFEIVPRNRPAANLFGRLQRFAIPGTTLADYRSSIDAAFAAPREESVGENGEAA